MTALYTVKVDSGGDGNPRIIACASNYDAAQGVFAAWCRSLEEDGKFGLVTLECDYGPIRTQKIDPFRGKFGGGGGT